MFRSRFAVFVACLLLTSVAPAAFAADYPEDMRGTYNFGDQNEFEDSLGFEAGLRYLYSYGNHSMIADGDDYSIEDASHILEGHIRIDDYSTSTFLRASADLTIKTSGSYFMSSSGLPPSTFEGGKVAAYGGDFGWLPLGNDTIRAGVFAGYQYMNESPDMGWTAAPGSRTHNAIDIHALRLGVSARANFADMFDVSADVAAIPYAWMTGTYGAYSGGAAEINGSLYGVAADVALGFHMTEQAIFRVGARGSYLTGQANLTSGGTTTSTSHLNFTRLGAYAELTYGF